MLVTAFVVGAINLNLLLLHNVAGLTVVPHFGRFRLVAAFLLFLPNGSLCLIDSNDVYLVMERGALRSERRFPDFVEDFTCLACIGRLGTDE